MKDATVLDDIAPELLGAQLRVCAGLAGEGEGPLALLAERDEGECGEAVGVEYEAVAVDIVGDEGGVQELAVHVAPHLTDEGGGLSQALEGYEDVCGRAAGIALEELLACS